MYHQNESMSIEKQLLFIIIRHAIVDTNAIIRKL